MGGGVGLVLGLIAVVFVQHATAQRELVVGDSSGWTVPANPTLYSDWAARNSFVVGDTLRFNFETGRHDVFEVSKESFDACRFDNTEEDIIRTGPATVRLNETGMHYFICTVGQHCLGGQKLSINVVATSAGGPMSPSSPRPPSSLPPPSPSSSSAVMASLYVTLSAIVMSLF